MKKRTLLLGVGLAFLAAAFILWPLLKERKELRIKKKHLDAARFEH